MVTCAATAAAAEKTNLLGGPHQGRKWWHTMFLGQHRHLQEIKKKLINNAPAIPLDECITQTAMDDDAPQQHFCDVDLLCIWFDSPTPLFSVRKWWNEFISLVHNCVCSTNDKNENVIHQCHSPLCSLLMFDWMACRPSLNSWKTMAFDVHNISVFQHQMIFCLTLTVAAVFPRLVVLFLVVVVFLTMSCTNAQIL